MDIAIRELIPKFIAKFLELLTQPVRKEPKIPLQIGIVLMLLDRPGRERNVGL